MQVARSEGHGGGDLEPIAQERPELLEPAPHVGGRRQVGLNGEVVSGLGLREVGAQPWAEARHLLPQVGHELEAVLLRVRRPLGKLLALLPGSEEGGGVLLGAGDVGLVERIDAEDDPGGRRGQLPAKELRADLEGVLHGDADDRVSRILESVEVHVVRPVTLERDGNEDAVRAVHGGRSQGLVVYGHQPLAVLAEGLREELLDPGAQAP